MEKYCIVKRPSVPTITSAALCSIWMPNKAVLIAECEALCTAYNNYRSRVIEAVNKGVL